MMKTLASIAAAALMFTGLSVATASADPYPPTVKTNVSMTKPASQGERPYKVKQPIRIFVKVTAVGTAAPKSGVITLNFQRKVGGKWRAVKKSEKIRGKMMRAYKGKKLTMKVGWFWKPGNYRTVVKFTPKAGTVFKPVTKTFSYRVIK